MPSSKTCPSADAMLCTYVRWFARPAELRQPGPLVMQPLTARCMRTIAAFQDGEPLIAYCVGRRTEFYRAPRSCQRCHLHAPHDERHLLFERPAMLCVRDRYSDKFKFAESTMQLFIGSVTL